MVTWAVENWFGLSFLQSLGLNVKPNAVILVLESHPGMPDDS